MDARLDYANDREDRKSYTGFTININGKPVIWKTKKQSTVSLSSTEAEYNGLSMVAQEFCGRDKFWLWEETQSDQQPLYADNREQ
jgi:hypothetical protein